MFEGAPVNTGAVVWPDPDSASFAVRRMQVKLHRRATEESGRRYGDLFNLVRDPALLVHAWERVRQNKGSRTPGVDGATVALIESRIGVDAFLQEIRDRLRSRTFTPVGVRQVEIPKSNGKVRRLGIPTVGDRVVQAALKAVLEPIFEADFVSCSYGFRPNRRAQDAVSEIQYLTSRTYEWVLEADIEACFDTIDHAALMGRIRSRISDARVLSLVKAFLRSGVMTTSGDRQETLTGTPQGGILSPLLANIALSLLDEHFSREWEQQMGTSPRRNARRRRGEANYRLIRYADDFVVVVAGERCHADRLRQRVTGVLAPMGLRLPRFSHPPDAKTRDGQVLRLHRGVQEGDRLDQGQGADTDQQIDPAHEPGRTAHQYRPGPAGVGELFPARSVQGRVQCDRLLRVGEDREVDTAQAQPDRVA